MITPTANKDMVRLLLVNVSMRIHTKLCQNVQQSDWSELQLFLIDLDVIIRRVSESCYYSLNVAVEILGHLSDLYKDQYDNNLTNKQRTVNIFLDKISLKRRLYMYMHKREELFRLINMSIFVYLLHTLHIDTSVIFFEEKELEEFISVNTDVILKQSDTLIREQDTDETKTLILGLLSKLQINADILLNKDYTKNIPLWIVRLRDYSEYKTFTSFKKMFISFRGSV